MNRATRKDSFCGRTRREFLWQTGAGFTGVALAGLLGRDGFLQGETVAADGVTEWTNPLAPKKPPFAAKAKSVIFLYMYGGPSQIDTFDYKPAMKGMDNKNYQGKHLRTRGPKKTKAALWNRVGNSGSMASAENGSRICFRIWGHVSMTSPLYTR